MIKEKRYHHIIEQRKLTKIDDKTRSQNYD